MHRHPHPDRQPFLDKFEGKKNIISKEGLIHLLENHISASVNRRLNGQKSSKGPV